MKLNRDKRIYFVLFIYLCPVSMRGGTEEEQARRRKCKACTRGHRPECAELGVRRGLGAELQHELGGLGVTVSSMSRNRRCVCGCIAGAALA